MTQGKFITLEGGEGSGKSTCLAYIQDWLTRHNVAFIVTREPGGTHLAEEIRQLVLSERAEVVHDVTELLLMFAARAQHVRETILPALTQGIWVISDRFVDSSYVYQGLARGGDLHKIRTLSDWTVGDCLPDQTFLFDVPVEIGQARVALRKQADRLDKESLTFHQTVRDGFLALAAEHPERFSVLDAAKPLETIYTHLDQALTRIQLEGSL